MGLREKERESNNYMIFSYIGTYGILIKLCPSYCVLDTYIGNRKRERERERDDSRSSETERDTLSRLRM